MKWTRVRPGLYRAGPYAVLNVQASIWTASGPNFTAVCGSKADAQEAAQRAAHGRLADVNGNYTDTDTVVPVVNDIAEYAGLRCRVSMITKTADGTPLYCLVKPRGKRQCLLRNEFKVVMP
ncbi:hypothetical protein STINGER_92 [Mycobacterium phage Stinger]|uniref:Uncharacterized protein n=1 Tax=Mycobacterium phage Stinger TaxID=1089137 RepID=G8I9L3_9CAUD|nr:hypothetical protein STINGER_92 [Mycobacterium phage Stinger]AER49406.1 hypothetical protein STINGER_92 [Mycobacterium phage Stinger]